MSSVSSSSSSSAGWYYVTPEDVQAATNILEGRIDGKLEQVNGDIGSLEGRIDGKLERVNDDVSSLQDRVWLLEYQLFQLEKALKALLAAEHQ